MTLYDCFATLAGKIGKNRVSHTPLDALTIHVATLLYNTSSNNIFEFAAGWGLSSLIIIDANEEARFMTSEIDGDRIASLQHLFAEHGPRVNLLWGDLKENPPDFAIDYLSIDSSHDDIVPWYIDTLFPLVKKGGMITVHDILDKRGGDDPFEYERSMVIEAKKRFGLVEVDIIAPHGRIEYSTLPPFPNTHPNTGTLCTTMVLEKK